MPFCLILVCLLSIRPHARTHLRFEINFAAMSQEIPNPAHQDKIGKANTPELKIIGVGVNEYRLGIPLKDWESVKAALNIFASGASKGSRATERHQLKAVGDSFGGEGLAYYGLMAPHFKGADSH